MDTENMRTYTVIDLDHMRYNLQVVRKLAMGSKVMQVLKADAYGHGTRMCARYAAGCADWFAAATFEEAMEAREAAPDMPVLLFGALADGQIIKAAESGITVSLFSEEYAEHIASVLKAAGKKLDGHIKLDTGMNRLGIRARKGNTEGAVQSCRHILEIPELKVTGMYTHFPVGDTEDKDDCDFTREQYETFLMVTGALKEAGFDIGLRHCVSTGGLLLHPEYRLDMVRTGMLGYGQSISTDSVEKLGLKPVLSWYAKVIDVQAVPAGESVSYGRIYRAPSDRRIAVLSVGYADGYLRAYRGAEVLIHKKRCPVVGKICMDYAMVDVTDCDDVKPGDTAILIGNDGDERIAANELTDLTDFNTNGGVTCGITARVPRIYCADNEVVCCNCS